MDCPNCGAKSQEHGPDHLTCPTCGDLVRNAKGEWEPGKPPEPVKPAEPAEPKPPAKPDHPPLIETPAEDDPYFGVGFKWL